MRSWQLPRVHPTFPLGLKGVWGIVFCLLLGCDPTQGTGTAKDPAQGFAAGEGFELVATPAGLTQSDQLGFVGRWTQMLPFAADLQKREPSAFRAVERGVLLRALMEHLSREALAQKPISDEERERVARDNWQWLEQPRAVRCAEVMLPVRFVESNEVALAKMVQLREAARSALSVEDLARKIQAVSGRISADTSARKLPPLTLDGRVVVKSVADDPSLQVDPRLLPSIAKLSQPGDVSEVVGTKRAFHFFYAIEVLPEVKLDGAERQRALAPLLAANRLAPEVEALRKRLRTTIPIARDPNRAALLERIGRRD